MSCSYSSHTAISQPHRRPPAVLCMQEPTQGRVGNLRLRTQKAPADRSAGALSSFRRSVFNRPDVANRDARVRRTDTFVYAQTRERLQGIGWRDLKNRASRRRELMRRAGQALNPKCRGCRIVGDCGAGFRVKDGVLWDFAHQLAKPIFPAVAVKDKLLRRLQETID